MRKQVLKVILRFFLSCLRDAFLYLFAAVVMCKYFCYIFDIGEDVTLVRDGKCFRFDDCEINPKEPVFEIQTKIDGPRWLAPGIKSCHRFSVNLDDCKAGKEETAVSLLEQSTGSTYCLKGIRNRFSEELVSNSQNGCRIKVSGRTASAACIIPDIDYKFTIALDDSGNGSNVKAVVTGNHDGFPSYTVKVNGKKVYKFKHEERLSAMERLAEDLDVCADSRKRPEHPCVSPEQ